MPIRKDYTVTSADNEISSVSASRTRDDEDNEIIILTQDGAEIAVPVDMAQEVRDVLNILLDA